MLAQRPAMAVIKRIEKALKVTGKGLQHKRLRGDSDCIQIQGGFWRGTDQFPHVQRD